MKIFKLIKEKLKKAIERIYQWIEGDVWGTSIENYDEDIIAEEDSEILEIDEEYIEPGDDDYGDEDYP